MLLTELAGWYDYHRVGHDRRNIELRPDGSIGSGAGDCEYQWFARIEGDIPIIAISGKVGVICDCKRQPDGPVFSGRWTQFERMPIELTPISVSTSIDPTQVTLVMNWDDGYEDIAKIVVGNRQEYASRHGYKIHEAHYPGSWGKLNAMLEVWDSADWLWWLDTDACVTNPEHKLESLIQPIAESSVIITCDRNGISAGSMLIRTVPEVRSIFEDLLKRRAEFDWPNGLWEQNGLMWMFWKIKDRVRILPQSAMNSYAECDCPEGSQKWEPGHFVLHCAGLRNEKRSQLLGEAVRNSI